LLLDFKPAQYQIIGGGVRTRPGDVLRLASAGLIHYPRVDLTGTARRQCPGADAEKQF